MTTVSTEKAIYTIGYGNKRIDRFDALMARPALPLATNFSATRKLMAKRLDNGGT